MSPSSLSTRYVAPQQLLRRLLDEPNLVAAIQALPATALGKVIDHVGLEDAGEIVALATTEQLRRIFDEDLWRQERPGKDESFDADRFALWLEVMLEAGETFTADKLAELPEDLVTLALHKSVLVVNIEQMALAMANGYDDNHDNAAMLEKALESCLCDEIDEYRIISRRHDGWDAILSVLLALDRDRHDFLARVLDRLCFLTAEYADDHGGLSSVLSSAEMLESDATAEREDRRTEEGYVAPSSAASFLALARTTALAEIVGARKPDPITAAYFRTWKRPSAAGQQAGDGEATPDAEAVDAATASASLLAILRDAEIVPRHEAAGLLEAPADGDRDEAEEEARFKSAMTDLRLLSPDIHARRMEELAFVTQVLAVGCPFEGRAMRPLEAARAAMVTVSLGMDHLVKGGSASKTLGREPVDKLFRIGWHLLFRDSSDGLGRLRDMLASRS